MTATAHIICQDSFNVASVYVHGGQTLPELYAMIHKAQAFAKPAPTFDAQDFAAAFVAANKGEGGGTIYVTQHRWTDWSEFDAAYVIHIGKYPDVPTTVRVYDDLGRFAARAYTIGTSMEIVEDLLKAQFSLKDIGDFFSVESLNTEQRITLSDRDVLALRTVLQLVQAEDIYDTDDNYAVEIVEGLLENLHLKDEEFHHQFYRMTHFDRDDLIHIQHETGELISRQYLDDEYGPSYPTSQSAVEAEEASLLVDPEDTSYKAYIVDDHLLVVAILWMEEGGQVKIQYPLENNAIINGLHYVDTF